MSNRAYQLGDWLIEPDLNRISRGEAELQLEPLAMNVLSYLVQRPGETVSIDELLDMVWADRVVEPSAVHRNVNQIRRALGDDPRSPKYIATISRRGYRVIAPVDLIDERGPIDADLLSALQARTPPYPAYDGSEPYVFVCYAHADRVNVYPELIRLKNADVNVWYDEGIPPGSEWTEELARAIAGCSRFLYYISPASVASRNCRDEAQFALKRGKSIITVYIEPTELPPGLDLSIGSTHSLHKNELSQADYERKLFSALVPSLPPSRASSTADFSSPLRSILFGKVAIVAAMILGALLIANLVINFLPANSPRNEGQEERSLRRFTIDLPRSMRARNYESRPVTISADGRRVVFNAIVEGQEQLFARSLDSLDVEPIKGTENASRNLAMSPDGEWIAFVDDSDAMLKKIPVTGGIAVPLCGLNAPVLALSWGTNGTIVYESNASAGLMRVSATGGTPEQLTTPQNGEFHKQPYFLPDGNSLFFTIGERGVTTRTTDRIAVLSLETGEQKVLMEGASPQATENGYLIYYLKNALWAVAFDADRLEVMSPSVPVTEGVHYDHLAHYTISNDGTLLYVLATNLMPRTLMWVDRSGNEAPLPLERRAYLLPRISPDGGHVALVVDSESGADLWSYSLDSGTSTRLTFDESLEASPVWSPDGKYLYYSSNRVDDLFRVTTDGTGEIEQLTDSQHYQFGHSITPDGGHLLLDERDSNEDYRASLAILSISSESTPDLLLETEFSSTNPAISPGGHWLAYESDRSGVAEIYVRPFPNVGTSVWQVSVGGGQQPRWNPNGRELIYWGPTDLMVVPIESVPDFQAGQPERLFGLRNFVYYDLRNFDVDPPMGERFLMVKRPSEDELPTNRIIVVQNWLDEVARKFATN